MFWIQIWVMRSGFDPILSFIRINGRQNYLLSFLCTSLIVYCTLLLQQVVAVRRFKIAVDANRSHLLIIVTNLMFKVLFNQTYMFFPVYGGKKWFRLISFSCPLQTLNNFFCKLLPPFYAISRRKIFWPDRNRKMFCLMLKLYLLVGSNINPHKEKEQNNESRGTNGGQEHPQWWKITRFTKTTWTSEGARI